MLILTNKEGVLKHYSLLTVFLGREGLKIDLSFDNPESGYGDRRIRIGERPHDLCLHAGISDIQFHCVADWEGMLAEYFYAQSRRGNVQGACFEILAVIRKKKRDFPAYAVIAPLFRTEFSAKKYSAVRTWFERFHRCAVRILSALRACKPDNHCPS
jgi:hypothetical protein